MLGMDFPRLPPLTGWFLMVTIAAILIGGGAGLGGTFFLVIRYGARSAPYLVVFFLVGILALAFLLHLIRRRQGA
jgi:hypothetical protein